MLKPSIALTFLPCPFNFFASIYIGGTPTPPPMTMGFSPLSEMSNHLTVFDLDKEYVIAPSEFMSMGRSTPFEGKKVFGRCLMTMCGGKIVWQEEDDVKARLI